MKDNRELSNHEEQENINPQISKEERHLIEIIRGIEFGEVRVIINNGRLNRIEEIKKSIKL